MDEPGPPAPISSRGDVQVSANFESRSGTPYARTVSFTGGQQITSQVVRVEPIGTRRMPTINLLHMRAEKSFRVTQGHRVSAAVEPLQRDEHQHGPDA